MEDSEKDAREIFSLNINIINQSCQRRSSHFGQTWKSLAKLAVHGPLLLEHTQGEGVLKLSTGSGSTDCQSNSAESRASRDPE